MKHIKKNLSALLTLIMLVSMTACAFGGTDSGIATDPTGGDLVGTYQVTICSAGRMALEGIGIYIYIGDDRSDMVDFGQTNSSGTAHFDLPVRSDYQVVLSGVPKGYAAEDSYTFTGNTAFITLTSSLITDEPLPSTLKAGNVMYDFSVTTPDGTKLTLSEILAEKELVLLNF